MNESNSNNKAARYVIFVHLTALPSWLRLSRGERDQLVERHANPVLAAHPEVRIRWIDVEAFAADSSDVLIAETTDVQAWHRLFDALRDTPLFAEPYFRLDRLYVGIEDDH